MFDKLRTWLGIKNETEMSSSNPAETLNPQKIVQKIRSREDDEMPRGQTIYRLDYNGYHLILDREFTGRYRISVFNGQHKNYGFTIADQQISDEEFAVAWDQIIGFLDANPSIQTLPDNKLIKGHYFGNPQ